ncbi:hypothetical protein HUW46_03813 [Amycolatopsis sp. CA-230715]|nr:hypothetical protein HUW46_03813 [Amycolatopsis sp. CA-230715]
MLIEKCSRYYRDTLTDFTEGTRMTTEELDDLARAAVDNKPRMFSIYGTLRRYPEEPVIGWGMEFPDGDGTIFRFLGSSGIHTSESPERVFKLQQVIADVDFTWL